MATPPVSSPPRGSATATVPGEPPVPVPIPVPPIVLSTTDDAAYLKVGVGSQDPARLFLVDASVLLGFSTWWSGQAPDEPAYGLDLGGVVATANTLGLTGQARGEEVVVEVFQRILEIMSGGQQQPPAEGWRAEHIWLAGLMHGVLGLPQAVIAFLRGVMGGVCGGMRWEGGRGEELDKGIAACLVFGWEDHWRSQVRLLGYLCGLREGRVVLPAVAGGGEVAFAEEICGRSALGTSLTCLFSFSLCHFSLHCLSLGFTEVAFIFAQGHIIPLSLAFN